MGNSVPFSARSRSLDACAAARVSDILLLLLLLLLLLPCEVDDNVEVGEYHRTKAPALRRRIWAQYTALRSIFLLISL